MTDTPALPPIDDKDWTWVLVQACPDCGFDSAAVTGKDLPGLIRGAAAAFAAALTGPDAGLRPDAEVWSPLEYSCHVRDVCRIMGDRLHLMLVEEDAAFPNWDQDETAVAERYWEQPAPVVADELRAAAESVAAAFARVEVDQWQRTGRRSNGSVFTVESLGRYLVHDLVHHVHDLN